MSRLFALFIVSLALNIYFLCRVPWTSPAQAASARSKPAVFPPSGVTEDIPSKAGASLPSDRDERTPPAPERSAAAFAEIIRANPLAYKIALGKKRGQIVVRYGGLVKSLHLHREVADKVIDQLTEEKMEIQQETLSAGDSGLTPHETFDRIQRICEQHLAEISGILSPSDYAALQDYRATLSARMQTEDIAAQLAYTDQPLTGQQQEALMRILDASRSKLSPQEQALYIARTGIGELYKFPLSDNILQEMAQVLSAGQRRPVYDMALAQMDREDFYRQLAAKSTSHEYPHP